VSIVYFDSSALVKLLISENGSDLVDEVWDGCDSALSSRLAYPEVCAALAAAKRNNLVSNSACSEAEEAWELYWSAMRPVELSADVAKTAGSLARESMLRGADSIHLASALAVGLDELIVAVWDRQLHTASLSAGLRVVPSSL
jgi:predicted nucleic acid-binding protein